MMMKSGWHGEAFGSTSYQQSTIAEHGVTAAEQIRRR